MRPSSLPRSLRAVLVCLLVLGLAQPVPARAAQACGIQGLLAILDPITRGLVSGLLSLTCTAVALPAVFGTVDPLGALPGQAQGEIRVTCNFSLLSGLLSLPPILVCYDIALSRSTGVGSYATRELAAGAHRVGYNLYTNSSRTTVWGDGSGGTAVVSDAYLLGLGSTTVSYPVYGRLPTQAHHEPGSYTDTLVATIMW